MNKLYIGVVLLMAIGFISCETDIEVNAEPTDITIVYGLIDPAETVHYIKINKAFLGDGNALDLAANSSNFNYTDAELNVRLDGNGKSYTLVRVTNEILKDDGIFDSSTNVLYKFTESEINRDATYTLTITNTVLNKEITSTTKIVNNGNVSAPKVTNTLGFWSGPVGTSGNTVSETVSISTGENVGRVQAFIVLNYIEYYDLTSGETPVVGKVIINLGEKKTADASNGVLDFTLDGQNFIDDIVAAIPADGPANFSHRELDNISIEYSIAGTELSTFMEAQSPSTTVNQDKPSYTNIINGIGIFSSRTYDTSFESNKSASTGLNIDNDTKRKLASLGLGFCLGTNATATSPCPY